MLTPKVLANFSPGLSFGNPGTANVLCRIVTLKGLRRCTQITNRSANPFRVLTLLISRLYPRVAKAQPWDRECPLPDRNPERVASLYADRKAIRKPLQGFDTTNLSFISRVAKAQPWDSERPLPDCNPERVASLYTNRKPIRKPFQGFDTINPVYIPGLPKLNPGLTFANTFGVT